MYLLAGLLERSDKLFRGRIEIAGRPLSESRNDLQVKVGLLLQDPARQLHQTTVLDELRSGPAYLGLSWEECEIRARAAAKGIVPESIFLSSPWKISVGQQQRVALAALLALDYEFLVLDEPFSCLDGSGALELLQILLSLTRLGKTILVSTHDIGWLGRKPDLIVLMAEGKVQLCGSPPTVVLSPSLEQAIGIPLANRVGELSGLLKKEAEYPVTWGDLSRDLGPPVSIDKAVDGKDNGCHIADDVLQTDHLYAGWSKARWAVKDVNIVLRKGQILGILGLNGSGKSTFGRALFGAVPLSKGDLIFKGRSLKGVGPPAGEVCFLAQNPSEMIFETTCLREVRFGPSILRKSDPTRLALSTIEEVGLGGCESIHPRSLSAGQQRLLNLASVLACEPSILVLDEPEYGLDQKSWHRAMTIVSDRARIGMGLVVITHNLELAFTYCTHIAMIEDGRVVWMDKVSMAMVHGALERFRLLSTDPEGVEWLAWSCINDISAETNSEAHSRIWKH